MKYYVNKKRSLTTLYTVSDAVLNNVLGDVWEISRLPLRDWCVSYMIHVTCYAVAYRIISLIRYCRGHYGKRSYHFHWKDS